VNLSHAQHRPCRVTARVNDDSVKRQRNEAPLSHTGQGLSRAVTFKFALDPNLEQRILFAKCAGARRYTVNHHLARVKSNLDARSTEREVLSKCGVPCQPPTPSLSWTAFSFINEFNAWKNGQSDDSPVDEDGTRGLAWRHELPGDVFECASVDAARALENFSSSWRGKRSGAPVGFPRFQAKGKVTPSFRLRNRATSGMSPSSQLIRFTDPAHLRLPRFGPVKLFGPTRKVRRMIDAGRFHVYSATLTQRAGRWTVSLTGVATAFHQAERSSTNRHVVPVGVDRGIISLCVAADANGVPFDSFEGGENTEASASIAQGGQPGPGQNHTGVQGSPASEDTSRKEARQGRQYPPASRPPSLQGPGEPNPGPRHRGPQRRRNGEEPTPVTVQLRRRDGRTLTPDPLQGQMARCRGPCSRQILPEFQDVLGLWRGQRRPRLVDTDLLV